MKRKKRERVACLSSFYVYTRSYVYHKHFSFKIFLLNLPFEKCLNPRLNLTRLVTFIRLPSSFGTAYMYLLYIRRTRCHHNPPSFHCIFLLACSCAKLDRVIWSEFSSAPPPSASEPFSALYTDTCMILRPLNHVRVV